jgi:hypothetical protein
VPVVIGERRPLEFLVAVVGEELLVVVVGGKLLVAVTEAGKHLEVEAWE